MKTKLLLLVLLFTSSMTFSQVVWTGGGGDSDWNNASNWSSNMVPSSMDDVEILSGFTVTISTGATCESLELKGNATLNIDTNGGLSSSQPSIFEAGSTVNWASGTIDCTLLVNLGTMNLTSSEDKLFEESTLVNNNGTINIIGSGNLFLRNTVLNNQIAGTIDMRAEDGNITNLGGLPILNNDGLIKRSTTPGEAQIGVLELNNNGGIIQVDSGTLAIAGFGDKNLNGGTYIVSSGAVLDLDSAIVADVLMGLVEGDLNWNNGITVPVSATFNFSGSGNLNWTGGVLDGGGTLTNQSVLNLTTASAKSILGDTTLNNPGTLNISDSGNLIIGSGSVVNNEISGIIDMQADDGNITGSGGSLNVLNNVGLIKRTLTTGEANIDVILNNNNGIVQVESGTLSFDLLNKNLTDGTYNVSSGALLNWDSSLVLSGVLSGQIDGTLNWNDIVNVPASATLNFLGDGQVNWLREALNGGGVLTNQSTLNLDSINSKFILEDTTLNNSGTINIIGPGDLFISQGILNNQAEGTLDLQANGGNITRSGGTVNVLNNSGLLKRTNSTGVALILVELNNSGTIEIESGELEIANILPFTNEVGGIIKGVGVFDLPISTNYTNDGVFAPGLSPGVLTVQGDYTSTSNSILDIELNGLTQGTEYDVLAITGNADFNGNVQITLGFNPDVNDEFIIATTTNTINTCNLPATTTSSFGGFNYEFEVLCRNNNELVLTVTNETLSVDSIAEEQKSIKLFPNPATDLVSFSDETIHNVTVFDINGRLVLTVDTNTFSVKNFSKGVYIVKAENLDGLTVSKKLIKQ